MSLPGLPDPHAIAVMVLTAFALILFTRDSIRLETTSLIVIGCLCVGFELFPYQTETGSISPVQFFSGFGNQALVAVCALMIVGQALVRTGALEPVGRSLANSWRTAPVFSLLMTLLMGAILSAFVNNTPIVVLMLPILINVSLRTGQSPTGSLMPMGLATIIGGMSTTIGTSTNLLVVQVAQDIGVAPFGMFDFMLPVLVAGGVAILYLWLVVPRMMPERNPPLRDTTPRMFAAQIRVVEGCPAEGKSLARVIGLTDGAMNVQRIQREDLYVTPLPDVRLKAGDLLLVTDTPERIRDYRRALGGQLYSGDHVLDADEPLPSGDQKIAEVVIMGGSKLDGVRLADARLNSRYKLTLLAFHRAGEVATPRSKGLRQRVLRAGDVLLVQGASADIEAVKRSGALLVLDGSEDLPHTKMAPLSLLVMVSVVAAAALGWMPIAISATLGVITLILTRCIGWADVTQALSVQVIFIIVASLALGSALMQTGGADYLAQVFVAATFGMSPGFVLAGLMLLMAVMTNVVSNNAAAVIGTPIAVSIAQRLGLPMEPFVLGVLFGANMSFATPMAYQTNLLVMNAGGYKFSDFVRVGVPLTLILWAVLSFILTWSYQL